MQVQDILQQHAVSGTAPPMFFIQKQAKILKQLEEDEKTLNASEPTFTTSPACVTPIGRSSGSFKRPILVENANTQSEGDDDAELETF